jgi:hypothetical protein
MPAANPNSTTPTVNPNPYDAPVKGPAVKPVVPVKGPAVKPQPAQPIHPAAPVVKPVKPAVKPPVKPMKGK